MESVHGTHRSVADIARQRNCDPVEAMIDLAVETDFNVFFLQPIANEDQDIALELMRLPRALVTFSDSGAHVSQLMDSSLQTHRLAYWVRERQAFTLEDAVRMLTLVPATQWGFHDRGLLRVGMAADMMVFDPDTIAAEMPEVVHDLPAGAKRLTQRTRGIAATSVNGQVLLKKGQHTGASTHGASTAASPCRPRRRRRRYRAVVESRQRRSRRGVCRIHRELPHADVPLGGLAPGFPGGEL